MTLNICIAGATGWTGRALVDAVLEADDLALSGAVARRAAGQDIGSAIGREAVGTAISASLAEALEAPGGGRTDVLIDYTAPDSVKRHVLASIAAGIAVVVGTSGLEAADYAEIDAAARDRGVGVIAAGNFSLSAALLQHFALFAARHVPHWEILDYAGAGKPDAPSGTARELAERLGEVATSDLGVAIEDIHGPTEARGAEIGGARVHSLRLPSYVLSCEAIFAMAGERLTLRHDAGDSAEPYVAGTLIAARKVGGVRGLVRGLDRILF